MSQTLIKQCTLQGGALAQAVRMTRLLCVGSLAGLSILEIPLIPGFRSPEIFPSHSPVGSGILILELRKRSVSSFTINKYLAYSS